MCGMENNGLDDTQPTLSNSQPGADESLDATRPMQANLEPMGEEVSLDATMPTPLGQKMDETMPTPGGAFEGTLGGLQDTAPTPLEGLAEGQTPPAGVKPPADRTAAVKQSPRKRRIWLLYSFLGLLALFLIGFVSAVAGYRSGIGQRQSAERTQVAQVADEQFLLGVQDLEQGQYARARQRFEYVVQLNPSYPGVTERLSEVYLALNTTATPTLVPTPTLTPTPDLRDVQELYDQGKQYLFNGDWPNAIDALLKLRKNDPNFQAIDVDGMLFLALRNRGSDKILKQADLEGGIYDLTLAGRFGPLDAEAQGLLNWTSLYITGASFWGIDWEQAVNYFSQVAPQLPNLMDGSKMTASERYRVALYEYGNALARQGHACKAVGLYQQSLAIAPNAEVQQAMDAAAKVCSGQEAGPQPTRTKKPRGTPSP